MSWTTPMTAVANAAFTAAQFNAHVRDNLLETAPAKATVAGRWFVTTGANAIAERVIDSATINTNEPCTGTSYGDIATVGPTVTVATGTSALVFMTASMHNGTADTSCTTGCAVSGATTIAASDDTALLTQSATTFDAYRATVAQHFKGTLTPGNNAFKMQYKVSAGTGQIQRRHLIVMAM